MAAQGQPVDGWPRCRTVIARPPTGEPVARAGVEPAGGGVGLGHLQKGLGHAISRRARLETGQQNAPDTEPARLRMDRERQKLGLGTGDPTDRETVVMRFEEGFGLREKPFEFRRRPRARGVVEAERVERGERFRLHP